MPSFWRNSGKAFAQLCGDGPRTPPLFGIVVTFAALLARTHTYSQLPSRDARRNTHPPQAFGAAKTIASAPPSRQHIMPANLNSVTAGVA